MKYQDHEEGHSFTQIGTESNQLLMKIAQKSGLHKYEYCQTQPTFSPRSNDNNVSVKSNEAIMAGSLR